MLWQNVRDAFASELKAMYNTLRSGRIFNYQHVKEMFENHQAVWPERLWNEDAYVKYLYPFLYKGQDYLDMLQGDKSSQRDWWLYNAFKYRDSKYQTGEAKTNFINFRAYTDDSHPISNANITVTPYSHIYAAVEYASTYTPTAKVKRNQSYTFTNPMDRMWDTEIHIYSADRLSDVGDLSAMNIGSADFRAATKLQSLILGKDDSSYVNEHLNSLTVGNNELLTLINVCNCTALTAPLDVSGCTGIETVLAKGSAITGVSLPNGGHLKKLQLPDTITNLTIQNQKFLTNFEVAGYGALTTLRIENTPNVPIETIVNSATNLERVRLLNIEWTSASESALQATITKLRACAGQDATGNNIDSAVVIGRVNVSSISSALLAEINEYFPDLVVVVNGIAQYIVRFMNYDNSVHYSMVVPAGGNASDPVARGLCNAPTKPNTDECHYAFSEWSSIPTNVQANTSVTAVYTNNWRVRYQNYDYATLYTTYVLEGGTASYSGSTPTRPSDNYNTYSFSAWVGSQDNITHATDIVANYTATVRTYTVKYYNGSTLLQTVTGIQYGGSATYTGTTPVHPEDSERYVFTEFSPSGKNITGDTNCYAQWLDTASAVVQYLKRSLTSYESDTATAVGSYAFYQMTSLTSVETTATSIGANAFQSCSNITTVDLTATSGTVSIAANAFASCSKLNALFIRSSSVATLAATNALPSSGFTVGDACVYVPADLVSSYKAATNWSTYASRIYPISAYPVTDFSTISDSWDEIFAAESDGTYATKYSVGDTKLLTDTSGTKVYMQIAAIDGDDLADDSGKAKITWLCQNFYGSNHNMNSSSTTSGGWPATAMRTYLTDTVLPKIPSNISSNIKTVHKTYYDYASSSTLTSDDSIWIPSYREVMFGTGKESSGVQYTGLFGTSTSEGNRDSRIKYNSSGSANIWWLRSAGSSISFCNVGNSGGMNYNYASDSGGVVFGFCT